MVVLGRAIIIVVIVILIVVIIILIVILSLSLSLDFFRLGLRLRRGSFTLVCRRWLAEGSVAILQWLQLGLIAQLDGRNNVRVVDRLNVLQ